MMGQGRRTYLVAFLDVGARRRLFAAPNLPQQFKPPGIRQRLRNQVNLFRAQFDRLSTRGFRSTHHSS
jgi:hypothetical protein